VSPWLEGNEHDSHSQPLTGTIITEQIQRACNAIVVGWCRLTLSNPY